MNRKETAQFKQKDINDRTAVLYVKVGEIKKVSEKGEENIIEIKRFSGGNEINDRRKNDSR